ncbi:MAG: BadF/BadG/BcrA/BcrD ATPase family protein [Microbacterium sp.]
MKTSSDGSTFTHDLVIDIGQSGVRGRLTSATGTHGFSLPFGPTRNTDDAITLVADRLAADQVSAPRRVCIGATGVWGDANRFDASSALDILGAQTVIVADDCVTSLLGALAGSVGVVIAIGTGIVGAALDPGGRVHRVGGHGLWLDDRGSGAWIGQQAVHRAIEHQERERDEWSGAILDLCEDALGPLGGLPAKLSAAPSPPALLTSLCAPLAALAHAGNNTAQAIFLAAGHHTERLARAAATAAGLNGSIPLCLVGGVARASDLLYAGMRSMSVEGTWNAVDALGDGLDGAEYLLEHTDAVRSTSLVRISGLDP